MSSIAIIRNGSSLAKALEEQKAKDAAKLAQIEEAKAAEQARLEAEEAKIQAKLAKEAERFAAKIQERLNAGEACTRCHRAGFAKACLTHSDAECENSFCEACYAFVVEQNISSRKFVTHNTEDCTHVQRAHLKEVALQKEKRSLELETESQMLRRLKQERTVRRLQEKAAEIARQEEHAKEIAEMKKRAFERSQQEKISACAASLPTGEEARAIWQQKATEIISAHQKQVEEEQAMQRAAEEALKAQQEAQILEAKKAVEEKIAKKKERLAELRAKIRDAKTKADDKKISNTQQKKAVKEAKQLEKEGETLFVEITVDESQLRGLLKRMK